MARVLRTDVHVQTPNGVVILPKGATVPKDLREYVTNPKAFTDVDDAVTEPKEPKEPKGQKAPKEPKDKKADKVTSEEADYGSWDYPRLKAEAKERELPQSGSADVLRARLLEDDVEKSKNPAGDSGAEDNEN